MTPLALRFVDAFRRAIDGEMEALRNEKGPFEVPLLHGKPLARPDDSSFAAAFDLARSEEKLAQGTECSLRTGGRELLVSLTRVQATSIELRCREPVPSGVPAVLVVYPWYLYERLKSELGAIDDEHFNVELALTLFGKHPTTSEERALLSDHSSLNESQRRAVSLCSSTNTAFVWGPPGTGKTVTLAHIVSELSLYGERILVTSTTNAAIDQALAKLSEQPQLTNLFERGDIVRIGQTDAGRLGTAPSEILARVDTTTKQQLVGLRSKVTTHERSLTKLDAARVVLEEQTAPLQHSLFGAPAASPKRDLWKLQMRGFPEQASRTVQATWLKRRRARVTQALSLVKAKIDDAARRLRDRERSVVEKARIVFATLTNVYLSPLLAGKRFDAVIVEEAGMASLPALFFAACLAQRRAIMVGDPRQLPPIVLSRDASVQRVMGRSIFAVTVPEPSASPLVALLDTQYRMHASIGSLVSRLYYDGRLRNHDSVKARGAIAGRAPFAGRAVIVIDTQGKTTCQIAKNSRSRTNEDTARLSARLARRAVAAGVEDVAVITPYADQSREIRKQLGAEASNVACSTVHRFQGHERDVVIFDAVDTTPLRPGVLTSSTHKDSSAQNLLNVSVSRARGKLILIADVAYFRTRAPDGPITELINGALSEAPVLGFDEISE